ncbi:MAG: dTDP-4-dehydrorhamnose reductase [Phycisphaerae bacterium]|nr:dTDP-4-dehydrorhamnose reductase [Phycisphaerae bacterium]
MRVRPGRVLVAGAKGLLGTPTVAVFRRHSEVTVDAADLPEMDITDSDQVGARFDAFRPDLVINCAAYTAVDACEDNEETARRVNGIGAGIVAQAAADHGARMIHISTDYVFEGDATVPYTEDHPTGRPEHLSAYGRSKLLGEQLVLAAHPDALIVRTAWLYGPAGRCFPDAVVEGARGAGELRVVDDQTGSPTYASDLAEALYKLACLDSRGIVHITNSGRCTWYAFACEILRLAGIEVPVTPVKTIDFPRPARRPAFSVLDNRRYVAAVGEPLRPWQDAIAEYVAEHARPSGL